MNPERNRAVGIPIRQQQSDQTHVVVRITSPCDAGKNNAGGAYPGHDKACLRRASEVGVERRAIKDAGFRGIIWCVAPFSDRVLL
ncbi:hypothetical protein KCP78_17785 [Salmonella enterica subsp. enterica]|nr:hypothetical protein KCP78_17785 [Salmonella enterica subsp. enterica]